MNLFIILLISPIRYVHKGIQLHFAKSNAFILSNYEGMNLKHTSPFYSGLFKLSPENFPNAPFLLCVKMLSKKNEHLFGLYRFQKCRGKTFWTSLS